MAWTSTTPSDWIAAGAFAVGFVATLFRAGRYRGGPLGRHRSARPALPGRGPRPALRGRPVETLPGSHPQPAVHGHRRPGAGPRVRDADGIRRQARLLGPLVDALQVPDAHDGRLQMSGLAAAAILLGEGVDPLVHLTGRDRNRIALENDLLGLGALGVTSLLLTRGEELPSGYKPPTRQVLELSGEDLVTTAVQLGEDESIPAAPEFCIGTAATVFAPEEGLDSRSRC